MGKCDPRNVLSVLRPTHAQPRILVSAWRMDNVFQCEDNGRPEYGVRQWDNVSNVEYGGIHLLSHYIKHVCAGVQESLDIG